MARKKHKKREAPISYRPPKALRDEFHARVKSSGLSTGAFLTQAWSSQDPPRQSRRPAIEEKLLAKLLAEAAAIRSELHEIASTKGAVTPSIKEAAQALTEIRAALLKAMGRNP